MSGDGSTQKAVLHVCWDAFQPLETWIFASIQP